MRVGICTAVVVLAAAAGAPAGAAPSAVPHSLVGCWHRNASAAGMPNPGVWHLSIKASGALAAANPSTPRCNSYTDFSGRITVKGSTLVIGPLPLCTGSGSYTWKAAGKTMTLHRKKDGCGVRVLLFAGTWKKS